MLHAPTGIKTQGINSLLRRGLRTPSYGYKNPHYKTKIVWRPSQVYDGNPCTNKTVSSLWIEAQNVKNKTKTKTGDADMPHWTGSSTSGYCQLDPKGQNSVKFQSRHKIFIHENASENIVCEMAAILSIGRWVKASGQHFIDWFNYLIS